MKIIGLTGGIGSGKSSVLEIFKKIGISTYNADESAKELISSDKKIIEVVNKIAPEHLELNIKNYKSFVPRIKSSGSVCLGKYAVMAMTDYNVGSNHILPTNGSAKYSSGVSVNEFYKRISYINLSKKGIESLGPSVITLANYEGLAGHAQSVKKRIRRK